MSADPKPDPEITAAMMKPGHAETWCKPSDEQLESLPYWAKEYIEELCKKLDDEHWAGYGENL